MKLFRILIYFLLIFNVSCPDDYWNVTPSNMYVPNTVPELAVEETVIKQGTINLPDGKENIVIIFPVVGVRLKDGKINVNQDVTIINGANIIDTEANIYGPDGLIIDVRKKGGNPNLTFSGIELVTEIVPPPDLTGTLLVSIVVKDLNSDKIVKFTKGFRSDKVINTKNINCIRTVPATKGLAVKNTEQVYYPAATQIELCSNDIIKTYNSGNAQPYLSGVDKITNQKEVDPFLIGKWDLSKPGFTWYNEAKIISGTDPNSDTPVLKTLPPGILTINQNKEFIWKKDNEITQGTMEQIIPRSYADPKLTYWKVYFGKNNYYIYFKDSNIYVNELESHLYTLIGNQV